MNEPEFVAQTLAWCNERRKEKGKEPLDKLPKGYRCDPFSCPCGKTSNLRVDNSTWRFEEGDDIPMKSLPDFVKRFVAAFDNGELPQYDVYGRTLFPTPPPTVVHYRYQPSSDTWPY